MTVEELIKRLALEDPNMRVVVNGYECGYDGVELFKLVRIKPNTKKVNGDCEWEGEFDWVEPSDETCELALCFPRKS